MPSKMGRPKSDNPKCVKMNIRITKQTAQDLQECADALQTSKINVIERGVDLVKKQLEEK